MSLFNSIRAKAENIKKNSVAEYIKQPSFNMFGNKEFFAEGRIRVEKYSDEEIILTVDKLRVNICGRGLYMCFYNKRTVKLTGVISALSFENI